MAPKCRRGANADNSRRLQREGRRRRAPEATYHRQSFVERLEQRRLLSGNDEQLLVGSIASALGASATNPTGLSAWTGKLIDQSALGRSLPLIGGALGSHYNPETQID